MKRIYWVGDSTAAYNDIHTYPQTGIGQVFGLYCKEDYTIYNYAKNGASSKSFYDSGRFEPVIRSMAKDDFLLIQFGHNDEKPKKDQYTEPYSTYQEYLMYYADAARKAGAHPVLVTPLSRRLFEADGTIVNSHGEYPQAMLALGRRENIPVVDLCKSSKELLEKTSDLESRKWFMNFTAGTYDNYQQDMTDNTHLHYEGAVKMAGLLAEEMCKLGGIYEAILLIKQEVK